MPTKTKPKTKLRPVAGIVAQEGPLCGHLPFVTQRITVQFKDQSIDLTTDEAWRVLDQLTDILSPDAKNRDEEYRKTAPPPEHPNQEFFDDLLRRIREQDQPYYVFGDKVTC